MMEILKKQGISDKLIKSIEEFVAGEKLSDDLKKRIPEPNFNYYGKEIWEKAIVAILSGENILLVGSKATGKNILADNLAKIFQRPSWNISFNVTTDSSSLIGTDTFSDGKVILRKGPIYQAAENGGFAILDEINMARNDAVAVLHATLDHRRIIDVPGYSKIKLHPKTRFIATMNYGYIGTRELNEALTSRFMVIYVPTIGLDNLHKLLKEEFPDINNTYLSEFSSLFYDINEKNINGEISSKSVDLRGLISSLHLIKNGLKPYQALEMGIIDKTFDEYEKKLVLDIIKTRIHQSLEAGDIFNA